MSAPQNEPQRWLDKPESAELIWRMVCVICALLVIVDFVYAKKAHLEFEQLPGFHAFFGFVAFVFVVLAGTQMRTVLMRAEDYYDQ